MGGALAGDPAERRVDGPRAQAAGLAHAHGGAAGGRHQHHPGAALGRLGGDRPDRRGLAGARAAGDDRQPVAERRLQRRLLLGGQLVRAGRGLPAAGAIRSLGSAAISSATRDGQLGLQLGGRAAGRSSPPRGRRGRTPTSASTGSASIASPSSCAASASSARQRQAARAAALGLAEHVHDRRLRRRWPGSGGRARRRRAIRSAMAKPTPNTLVSWYGSAVISSWARAAVVLVQAAGQVGETVGREQQVQPAGDAQLLPGAAPPPRRARGSAPPRKTPGGVAVDDVEHVGGAEACHQVVGALGPDVLDAPQVAEPARPDPPAAAAAPRRP